MLCSLQSILTSTSGCVFFRNKAKIITISIEVVAYMHACQPCSWHEHNCHASACRSASDCSLLYLRCQSAGFIRVLGWTSLSTDTKLKHLRRLL